MDTSADGVPAPAAADTAGVPDTDASAGAASLTTPTATGNVASTASPESLKTGSLDGSRALGVSALKSRLAHIESLLKLDPSLLPKGYRDKLLKEKADLTPRLERSAALNFLAQSAWAAGAPPEIVKALDTAPIKVVPTGTIESDAAFDEKADVILVSQSLIDSVNKDIDDLSAQDIIGDDDEILDPSKLKHTRAYHDLAVTQALFGAHEVGHEKSDATGENDAQKAVYQQEINQFIAADGSDKVQMASQLARDYIDRFEYEQYLAQEQYQFQMGAAPEQTHWMTIDNNGQPIDRETAVNNLTAYLTAHGFDAATAVSIAGTDQQMATLAQQQEDYEGGRFPGGRFPGGRFPGGRFPGGRFPGGRFPGGEFQGGRFPGGRFPGGRFPGGRFPGHRLK